MDPLLSSNRILNNRTWLFFRLYKDPSSDNSWQNNLNWYHQTLINVARPIINANKDIMAVFFGIYGPEQYDNEDEAYERNITAPQSNVVFIRLRVAVKSGKKNSVKNAFVAAIGNNRNLVWDYEVMNTFNVSADIGSRFGSKNAAQTLRFVRYWDAACRYILSILSMPGNWTADVDVWGIPHMVNNSIGAWLKQKPPQVCSDCRGHMYMDTVPIQVTLPQQIRQVTLPLFAFICPNCQHCNIISSNI